MTPGYERFAAVVGECARAHGVSDEVARRVAEAIRPSVRLISSPAATPATPGACRLGGLPDLPAGVQWPTFPNPDYGGRDYPYRFLMQVDLSAVQPFDAERRLPPAGHLYFFCHWQDENENSDWAGERSRVLFAEAGAALRRANPPAEAEDFRVYRPKGLTPAGQWMVPAPCEAGFEAWADSTPWAFFEEVEARVERVGPFADDRLPNHRVLGYADFIQSPGLGDGVELLAQVDTDLGPRPDGPPRRPDDMLWGDAGTVYFLIAHDDLAAREFGRAWSSVEMC